MAATLMFFHLLSDDLLEYLFSNYFSFTHFITITITINKHFYEFASHSNFYQYVELTRCPQLNSEILNYYLHRFSLIRVFDISNNASVNDRSIQLLLFNLTQISSLNLSNCSLITDNSFLFYSVCKARLTLNSINLSSTDAITDKTATVIIESSPNLMHFYLSDCDNITDKSILAIAASNYLQSIALDGVSDLTDRSVQHLLHNCAELTQLDLSELSQISQSAFININPGNFIRNLCLSSCIIVNDEAIALIARACSLLEELNVEKCKKLTDACFKSLQGHHQLHLKSLNCSGLELLTDCGIDYLCNSSSRLSLLSLSIDNCSLLTDESLYSIGANLNNLTQLNVNNLWKLTGTGVNYLAKGCVHLQLFKCIACYKIQKQSLYVLPENCRIDR
jgi:hypothetical protein